MRIIHSTSEPAFIYTGKQVAILEHTEARYLCPVEFRPVDPGNQQVSEHKHAILWDLVDVETMARSM